MAVLDVQYTCGCGFRTTEPMKAIDHVNTTKHTLTVVGTIRPGTPSANARPSTSQKPEQQVESEFDRLRKLLGR